RILYVAPELVHEALGGRALPFVGDPVQNLTPASQRLAALLADIDGPVSDLARADIAVTIADSLSMLSGRHSHGRALVDTRAVAPARAPPAPPPCDHAPPEPFEKIPAPALSPRPRHFRRAFGISPDQYRIRRRLNLARSAIESGVSLAQAAADAGFADQSHLTRQFKQAYGLTPGRWASAVTTHPA